jgi:hypothetical protein
MAVIRSYVACEIPWTQEMTDDRADLWLALAAWEGFWPDEDDED